MYDGVVGPQRELNELSRPFSGQSDGSGTESNSAGAYHRDPSVVDYGRTGDHLGRSSNLRGFAMNSKLVSKLTPWCVVLFVIGGCGSILYPHIQGSLEYRREEAPFRAVGGYVTATGGGDMGLTAGRAGIAAIRLPESVGDEQLAGFAERMQRFPHLRALSLSGPMVTDTGLAHLVRLGQLEQLVLNGTGVTQKGKLILERALPKLKIDVYGQ
jgi:hypothetical protein